MRWFWNKKEEQRRRVQVYDFDTKAVSTIPAEELAPGMMCIRMQGIEGEVWVDAERLQMNTYQHPPFPEEVRDLLRHIETALQEVYPLTLDEWEDGFRRDKNPDREIAHWLHLTQVYSRLIAPDAGALPIEKKRDVFRILVGCGISPREQVLIVMEKGSLSREEAEAVVAAFYG